jgi:hypothetical protein
MKSKIVRFITTQRNYKDTISKGDNFYAKKGSYSVNAKEDAREIISNEKRKQ